MVGIFTLKTTTLALPGVGVTVVHSVPRSWHGDTRHQQPGSSVRHRYGRTRLKWLGHAGTCASQHDNWILRLIWLFGTCMRKVKILLTNAMLRICYDDQIYHTVNCLRSFLSSCHPVTQSFVYLVTWSLGHSVTQCLGHSVTWSLGHSVTRSFSHLVT